MAEFTVETNGAALFGVEQGYGAPIVFLHAGVADHRMWQPQLDALGLELQAIAYDQRGYGRTQSADVAYSDVDDLLAVLDHFKIGRAILVGCSLGGGLALAFALTHPDRVAGLMLVAASIPGAPAVERDEAELQLATEYEAKKDLNDLIALNQFEARLWLDGAHGAEGRVQGQLRELFLDMNELQHNHPPLNHVTPRPECYSRLGELRVPVLNVAGTLDLTYFAWLNDRISDAHPHMQTELIADAGHLPNLDQPEVFNAVLSEFLAGV